MLKADFLVPNDGESECSATGGVDHGHQVDSPRKSTKQLAAGSSRLFRTIQMKSLIIKRDFDGFCYLGMPTKNTYREAANMPNQPTTGRKSGKTVRSLKGIVLQTYGER